MMRHRNDTKLVIHYLINDAVRKPAKQIAAATPTKDGAEKWVLQSQTRCSLKLSHERESKCNIRSGRIKGRCIVQLGECKWSNDKLHFNAART